ncbi:glycoside hydrolase family 3 N-terminal domain-containing protein [Arthrobacter sp. NPDC056691]|uniref:glycoside hydrolase family 3 N-terminal domain-containing protein n=1 Tax=Arthrobacter sp. NPDC056691 TaxID=3345913 RepID=UPI0036728820
MATSIPTPETMAARLSKGIGHLSSGALGAAFPKQLADINNGVQRYLLEHTRLGIPAMLHAEALNGFTAPEYTSFPTAIGLAATWDPDAVQEMADTVRRQMRSVGFAQALSPVIDIARDARWGRVHENYGEDVLLTSSMGIAYVRGIQSDDLYQWRHRYR